MKWEINGVSTELEEILEELKNQNLPLGVIVFGADSGLKAKVYKLLRSKLGEPLSFDRTGLDGYVGQVKASFRKGHPVLVCISGDDSLYHGLYCQLAKRLQNLGARTVACVYVKVGRRDNIDFTVIDKEEGFDHQAYYRQIKKLTDDPPSFSGFSCSIIVEDDD